MAGAALTLRGVRRLGDDPVLDALLHADGLVTAHEFVHFLHDHLPGPRSW